MIRTTRAFSRRGALCVAAAGIAAVVLPTAAPRALAQAAWPTKPIRVVVPFPAGGPVDSTMRAIGARLSATLGQTVVIDNKGGAAGTLGADAVAKAPPDGYTLLFSSAGALSIVPNLSQTMPRPPARSAP